MEEATTITPIQAAEATGLSVYEFDVMLRDQAAGRLENLASHIRRGHEADEDVDLDEYDSITEGVRNQLESAKVCTAHWVSELQAEMGEEDEAAR